MYTQHFWEHLHIKPQPSPYLSISMLGKCPGRVIVYTSQLSQTHTPGHHGPTHTWTDPAPGGGRLWLEEPRVSIRDPGDLLSEPHALPGAIHPPYSPQLSRNLGSVRVSLLLFFQSTVNSHFFQLSLCRVFA